VVKDTTFLPGAAWFTGSAVLDSERGFLYFKTSPDGIGRIRTSGMVEDLRVPATGLGIDLAGVKAIDSRGDLYVTHGITEQSFRKIDGDTLQVVASASFSSQVQLATVSAYTLTGRIDFVLALGFLSAPARIFFADDLSVFWSGQSVSSRPGGLVGGLSDFGACEAWFAAYPSIVLGNPTATVSILHVRLELPFTVSPVTGFPATVKPNLITLAASELGAAELTISQLRYDEQNDRLLFISSLDGVRHLVSYSAASGIVWFVPVSGDLPHQARFTDGKIRLVSGTSRAASPARAASCASLPAPARSTPPPTAAASSSGCPAAARMTAHCLATWSRPCASASGSPPPTSTSPSSPTRCTASASPDRSASAGRSRCWGPPIPSMRSRATTS
jgi:hypothetical protein